jgi:hypothetical protein
VASSAGLLIAGASSFVRTSWQQLRTGEAEGAGQDVGDAAAAGGLAAAGGEKPEAARADREREQAEAVAPAKAAVRGEMEEKLQQAKVEATAARAEVTAATAAMAAAVQRHAAEVEAAKNSSKVEATAAAAAAAAETMTTAKQVEAGKIAEEAVRGAKIGDEVTVAKETKVVDSIAGRREEQGTGFCETLKAAGLSEELTTRLIIKASIDTVKKLKTYSVSEIALMVNLTKEDEDALDACIVKLLKEADGSLPEDEDLPTIKAKTMYKMVEDVEVSKAGIKKLLFLSSKQADLIARDPSAIDKMLAIFVGNQQPRMVINLLPSMIRCWTRVRPPPGDPDGEREGLAALDRFMAEHIIPLAEKTHAIILCAAVQPFCVLSESLSRMLKLVRSRWGPELPFTILSCTGQLPALYTVRRDDTTWREIRNLSKVWKKREKEGSFADAVKAKIEKNEKNKSPMNDDFDMDLDPNGTNFIIVDPTSSSANYDSYNGLVTEIVRKLAAELPSIAIQTGKSKFSNLAETNAAGIEVALSNMEADTPVLLLDLTKRDVMPEQLANSQRMSVSSVDIGPAASEPTTAISPEDALGSEAPLLKDGPPARRRQIEWYREQVEIEERRRVDMPGYDWDVCMIAHFHDGARRTQRTAHKSVTAHNTHTRTHIVYTAHVAVYTHRTRTAHAPYTHRTQPRCGWWRSALR